MHCGVPCSRQLANRTGLHRSMFQSSLCAPVCPAVLGAAQKELLNDEKRDELWMVLEMARGEHVV